MYRENLPRQIRVKLMKLRGLKCGKQVYTRFKMYGETCKMCTNNFVVVQFPFVFFVLHEVSTNHRRHKRNQPLTRDIFRDQEEHLCASLLRTSFFSPSPSPPAAWFSFLSLFLPPNPREPLGGNLHIPLLFLALWAHAACTRSLS